MIKGKGCNLFAVLSTSTGIPVDRLTFTTMTGLNEMQITGLGL